MPRPKYLHILDRSSGDSFIVRLRLPLHFGRNPSGPHVVQLDPTMKVISSAHGVMTDDGGVLVYSDTSTNGSLVGNMLLRKASMPLPDKFTLQIGAYVVTPTRTAGFMVTLIGSDGCVSHADACRGGEVSLVEAGPGVRLAPVGRFDPRPEGIIVSFRIEARSAQMMRSQQARVTVNGVKCTEFSREINPNSVVIANGHRVEFLRSDQRVRVCGNGACRLLTEQPLQHECKWCGHALVKGTTAIRQTTFGP